MIRIPKTLLKPCPTQTHLNSFLSLRIPFSPHSFLSPPLTHVRPTFMSPRTLSFIHVQKPPSPISSHFTPFSFIRSPNPKPPPPLPIPQHSSPLPLFSHPSRSLSLPHGCYLTVARRGRRQRSPPPRDSSPFSLSYLISHPSLSLLPAHCRPTLLSFPPFSFLPPFSLSNFLSLFLSLLPAT